MNEAQQNELSGAGKAGANLTELLNDVCCKVFENEKVFLRIAGNTVNERIIGTSYLNFTWPVSDAGFPFCYHVGRL